MAEPTPQTSGSATILGMPRKYVLPGAVVFGLVAILWFRNRKNAQAAAAASASNPSGSTAVTPTTTDATAGIATDQYESLLAQLRDVQGNIASIPPPGSGPAGPAGPPGTPGPAGPVGPPGPTPPVPARPPTHVPGWHYVSVPGKGTYSLNDIAKWNGTTPAAIINETRKTEPTDVANYLKFNNFNRPLPVGTVWATPVFS